MGVVRGEKIPDATKATLTELWKEEFAHSPKAKNDVTSNESPLTLEAWRNADEIFKKLKTGGFLDAPVGLASKP